jgi:uncharacterized coiled-coil DUF342 family protein
MTIKQALKAKNKLVAEIKEQYKIAKEYNSIEAGNKRRFDIAAALDKANALSKELVALKAKIHAANTGVYDKIFEMSELKSQIKELRAIPTVEGKTVSRYGSVTEIKEVAIDAAQMATMIKGIEARIEVLQDELDTHNATATI